jgi:hypothetical protein
MFCFIHKWGKWEQYEVTQPARQITKRWGLCAAIEYRQRKTCSKCGKVNDELISTKVLG